MIFYLTMICSKFTLIFSGCGNSINTLYLRQAEITGPIVNSPIHLSDSSETPLVTISPSFSYNTHNILNGEIEETTYYFVQDTSFVPSKHSLTWTITQVIIGVDFDFALTKIFAISLGLNYSKHDYFATFGGNIGIGYVFYKDEGAFRIDAGLKLNSSHYDIYSVGYTTSTSYQNNNEFIAFFRDTDKSTQLDPYFNITFNTCYDSWPLNMFVSFGYTVQTLFIYKPSDPYYYYSSTSTSYEGSDLRESLSTGFIHLTPGIYLQLSGSAKILVGSHFYFETQIEQATPIFFMLPFVQLSLGLEN